VLRVWNVWLWRGDVGLARSYIDQLPPQPDWRFMEIRFLQALYGRRFDAALTAAEPFAGQWMRTWILVRPVVLFEAQAARLQGDRRRAARAFAAARDEIARLLASPAHFSEQTFRLDPRWDVLR
jgi:hypothetical protein